MFGTAARAMYPALTAPWGDSLLPGYTQITAADDTDVCSAVESNIQEEDEACMGPYIHFSASLRHWLPSNEQLPLCWHECFRGDLERQWRSGIDQAQNVALWSVLRRALETTNGDKSIPPAIKNLSNSHLGEYTTSEGRSTGRKGEEE